MADKHVSVSEAAQRLDLGSQRVRALIADGRLRARRVGNQYVLEASEVASFRQRERVSGRPLGARSAWWVLAQLSGRPNAVVVSPRTYYRVRELLGSAEQLVRALSASEPRSQRHAWRVLPSDLEKLRRDSRIVLTGMAADEHLIDVSYQPDLDGLDAYVSESQLAALDRGLMPVKGSREPNLVLRVPNGGSWVLDESRAPFAVVAADLLDHRDERVRRSARRALIGPARGD